MRKVQMKYLLYKWQEIVVKYQQKKQNTQQTNWRKNLLQYLVIGFYMGSKMGEIIIDIHYYFLKTIV